MPTPTYTPLATVTLGSSASSITFSSIPATYRDLVLVANKSDSTDLSLRFNGDTGSNYFRVFMIDFGGAGASGSQTNTKIDIGGGNLTLVNIMDYSTTNKHKTVLDRMNSAGRVQADAQRWANTSAITTVLISSSSSFAAGATFNLYGIVS
jgi:hypothetical protein